MGASEHIPEAALAVGAKTTGTMTHGGAVVTVLGGMALNDIAVLVGIVVSVLGLLCNMGITWYWKRAHYLLEREQRERSSRGAGDGDG